MKIRKSISIIFPIYNEAKRLPNLFKNIKKNKKMSYILVNDGSTDNSDKLIKNFIKNNNEIKIKYLKYSMNRGKGYSIKINNEMNTLKIEKEKNQPTQIMTSGSTFKNPILQTKKKVWELIKDSVPLNKRFGDACISEKHCNFFVNKGNASFNDMKQLIDFVSKNVLEKTGISLEKEIKILE